MRIQHLLEGLSPVLYFFTKNPSAYNIAKNGWIDLGLASRNEYEVDISNGMFFLSTTRSRVGGFHKDKSGGTLFTLDGNKLRQKYSGKPTDYYHQSSTMPDEMEDRIVTKDSRIPLLNYVTRADVHWSEDAKAMYAILRKRGIPVYVYENQNDWLLGNKNKAMSHEAIVSKEGRTTLKKERIPSTQESDIFDVIFKLYNAKQYDDIDYNTRTKIKDLLYDDSSELRRVLNNVGVNWRKRDHYSDQLNKLTRIFKRERVTNARQFGEVLRDKLDELSKKEKDKRDKDELIKNIKSFTNMMDAVKEGESPIESATKHVHDDISEYPTILKNKLTQLFVGVNKFYTRNLERYVKDLFPMLRDEDFSIEDAYENSKNRAISVLRKLGVQTP